MKKKLKNVIIIFLSVVMCLSITSFAAEVGTFPTGSNSSNGTSQTLDKNSLNNTSSTSILAVSSAIIGTDTEFYLVINLNNITYNKFSVKITNTSSLAADDLTGNVTNLSTNSVITSFEVDKTQVSNLNKLGVVYTSPSQDSTVSFSAEITNLDSTELNEAKTKYDDATANLETINTEITNAQTNYNTISEEISSLTLSASNTTSVDLDAQIGALKVQLQNYKDAITEAESKYDQEEATVESYKSDYEKILNNMTTTESISVKVSKDAVLSSTEMSDSMKEMNEKMLMNDKERMSMADSMKEMMSKVEGLQSDLDGANLKISNLTTSVTYQGSQNNYLSSLSLTGVDFKNTFNKTSLTYFATVDSSVNSVTVNAKAEDSSASVVIYGNTSLKQGKNKILVTVTADDGSTRVYKIYVTKN